MRELIIARILEYTCNSEYLEDQGFMGDAEANVEEVKGLTDEALLDLFEEVIFPG